MSAFDLLPFEAETEAARFGMADAIHVLPWRKRPAVEFSLRKTTSSANENLIFFRERRRGNNWNFALIYEGTFDNYIAGQPINWAHTLDLLQPQFFENCLRWHSWGRVIHFTPDELPVSGQWRASLGTSGEGAWIDFERFGSHCAPSYTPFRWHPQPCAKKLWDWEINNLRAHLLTMAQDEKHDVGFSLRWTALSRDQRKEHIFNIRHGTWAEANFLLSAVMHSERQLWHQHTFVRWCLSDFRYGLTNSLTCFNADRSLSAVELSPRMKSWFGVITDYYFPDTDENFWREHACIARETLFDISCSTPTAHEQMEANVTLRQWAKGKVSPARLRILLFT